MRLTEMVRVLVERRSLARATQLSSERPTKTAFRRNLIVGFDTADDAGVIPPTDELLSCKLWIFHTDC